LFRALYPPNGRLTSFVEVAREQKLIRNVRQKKCLIRLIYRKEG
jgi:hypothetical protein